MLWSVAKIKTIVEPANDEAIYKAANIIKDGGLVAFPTETVYGLGANAFNADAAKKIYMAKGRPSDNPLIVHVYKKQQLENVVESIPPIAEKLIEAFCPGPLTFILRKNIRIPEEVCGKLETIAVRIPSNDVARKLIEYAGVPIAAPSANSSGRPSPTKASHVLFDLDGKIDMILDDGKSTQFGIESTILDLTEQQPKILRPGSITARMIQNVIGDILIGSQTVNDDSAPKAPGMKYMHYSPLANVTIVKGETLNVCNKINALAASFNGKVGVLCTDETKKYYNADVVLSVGSINEPETIARNLFDILRKFDYYKVLQVYSEGFFNNLDFVAIMNRLHKAANGEVLEV